MIFSCISIDLVPRKVLTSEAEVFTSLQSVACRGQSFILSKMSKAIFLIGL